MLFLFPLKLFLFSFLKERNKELLYENCVFLNVISDLVQINISLPEKRMFFGNGYRVCTAKIDADALVRLLPKAKVLTMSPCRSLRQSLKVLFNPLYQLRSSEMFKPCFAHSILVQFHIFIKGYGRCK